MTREELLAKKKAYRESHKEEIRAYRESNKSYSREYRVRNHQRILEARRAWETAHKDELRKYRESRRSKKNERERERLITDVNFCLQKRLRNRFRAALKQNSKNGSAIRDLGCSIEEFKKYIESKFQGSMSWDNRNKWHLDHVIPLSKFNLQDPQQIKIALHYTNYQPMGAN